MGRKSGIAEASGKAHPGRNNAAPLQMGVHTNKSRRCSAIFGDAEVVARKYEVARGDLRPLLEKRPERVMVN